MRIVVKGAEPSFRTSLEHLVRLFYDEPQFAYDDEGGDETPQMILTLEVRGRGGEGGHSGGGEAVAVLELPEEGVVRRAAHRADGGDETGAFRKALLHATLRVLEEHTGMRQPWGILTGVRPTKLMHRKVKNGVPPERAAVEVAAETGADADKTRLMQRIVERQLAAVPDLYRLGEEVSVYIGIPFCPTKCAYCTFPAYSIQGRQGSVSSFLDGLHYEMEKTGQWLRAHGIRITTVYFGGGTPTSITAEEMDRLYDHMYRVFPEMDRVREVTVEAGRPDTITREKLAVLKRWNIGRISINPQSYIQETLNAIGRHHTVQETIDAFRLAREMGMDNINMDLIIGLPGEGREELAYTLEQTEKLMPESLTVHTLSFKRASEMTRNKDKYRVAGRDEIGDMMRMASAWTDAKGYVPYYLYRQKNILGNLENIGYALPGYECLYNILMMEEVQTIVGLGCGASSKLIDPATGGISRLANPKEPRAYIEQVGRYTDGKIEALQQLFGNKARSESSRDTVNAADSVM
jgi:oxygen-independent coproporphyrinogen-3 oxidase